MASFVTPITGQAAVAESVAQITEDLSGLRNIPLSVTGINDAASFALALKNVGAGAKGLIIYAADGTTILLQVDANGVKVSADGTTPATSVPVASNLVTLTGAQAITGQKTHTLPIADAYTATGLTGSVAASRYVGATTTGAPTTGLHAVGDFVIDQTGKVWICTVAGTPGTWANAGAAAAMTTASNILGADVALNNASNYFDGPSMAQGTAGTWWVSGTVSLASGAGNTNIDAKLWDGTTVIASVRSWMGGGAFGAVTLSGFLASPVANIRISVKASATDVVMKFNATGNSKDSHISGLRIG